MFDKSLRAVNHFHDYSIEWKWDPRIPFLLFKRKGMGCPRVISYLKNVTTTKICFLTLH